MELADAPVPSDAERARGLATVAVDTGLDAESSTAASSDWRAGAATGAPPSDGNGAPHAAHWLAPSRLSLAQTEHLKEVESIRRRPAPHRQCERTAPIDT